MLGFAGSGFRGDLRLRFEHVGSSICPAIQNQFLAFGQLSY